LSLNASFSRVVSTQLLLSRGHRWRKPHRLLLLISLLVASCLPFLWYSTVYDNGSNSMPHGSSWASQPVHTAKPGAVKHLIQQLKQQQSFAAPADFNWRGYLLRNADLRDAGLRTMAAAHEHYQLKGRLTKRQHQRVPILLQYTACQGLFNQMYAHLAAFLLAFYLEADVVLPHALHRDSFESQYSAIEGTNKVQWMVDPVGALLDVDAIKEYHSKDGRMVYMTPSTAPAPNCTMPEKAYATYKHPGVSLEQVVTLDNVYLRGASLNEMWDYAADAVMKKYYSLAAEGYPENTTIVLSLPCTFFSIMTVTCIGDAEGIASILRFNSTVEKIADDVVARIRGAHQNASFNGLHLRMEKDAVDWLNMYGGSDAFMQEYISAMQRAGLNKHHDLYIASGLLSYASKQELEQLNSQLAPYGKKLLHKGMFVSKDELAALNSEQAALLDFLVLSKSKTFVGLGSSTFSVFLREYRRLHGHRRRSSNFFLSSKAIGTDLLFQRCSHFSS